MGHPLFGASYKWDGRSNNYINTNHQRIAQIINDYDPQLFLCWIPPDKRTPDNPYTYALVHQPSGKPEYVARTFREDEVDERILAWVFRADNNRFDTLTELDSMEAARNLVQAKEWEETREKMKDFARSVYKSPKHSYKHEGKMYN